MMSGRAAAGIVGVLLARAWLPGMALGQIVQPVVGQGAVGAPDLFSNPTTNPYMNPWMGQLPSDRTTAGLYMLGMRRHVRNTIEQREAEAAVTRRERAPGARYVSGESRYRFNSQSAAHSQRGMPGSYYGRYGSYYR